MLKLSYVLPYRASADVNVDELTAYLRWLAGRVEVVVVDGSGPREFEDNRARWEGIVTHLPPNEGLDFDNGKVDGVVTGIEIATFEKVVVADDDIRYDDPSLAQVETLLDDFDLVRPQNFFDPMPWHALWDSGRILLNRAFFGDYPGTLAVRRSLFIEAGGYDGNVMFENLEMIRTLEEAGARSSTPLGLYVRRLPPTIARFLQQRPRQAYDDLAQPWRLVTSLLTVPAIVHLIRERKWGAVLTSAGVVVGIAELGRRRAGGTAVFPALASLAAPLWVLERGACSWLALVFAVRGGVPYGDRRIRKAANSRRRIRSALVPRSMP